MQQPLTRHRGPRPALGGRPQQPPAPPPLARGRPAACALLPLEPIRRRRAHTPTPAAAGGGGAAPTAPDESLYTAKGPPPAWLGPVAPARYVGTGRGLEAARTLAAGELLLVSEPLALIEQPTDGFDDDDDDDNDAAEGAGDDDDEEDGEGDEDEGAKGGGGGGEDGGGGGEGAAYVPTDADVDALVAQLQARAQQSAGAAVSGCALVRPGRLGGGGAEEVAPAGSKARNAAGHLHGPS
jgi:hypothetical protein